MIKTLSMKIKFFFVSLFSVLLKILSKVIKKTDSTLCFDCLYDKNQEQNDAYSYFMQIKQTGCKAKYVALSAIRNQFDNHKEIIFVKNKWHFVFRYLFLIAKSKQIYTSFGLFDGLDEIFKKHCEYIFIGHGVTYIKSWVSEIYSKNKFSKILVPTKFTFDLYKKNNLWVDKDMILSDLPRWSNLNNNTITDEIFVFFTWRKEFLFNKANIDKYLNAIVQLIENLRKTTPRNIKISFAWHHELHKMKISLPEIPLDVNLIRTCEISKAINSSSLLITDYSSIFWDYFYLNKPVVFYRFDFNSYSLESIDGEIMQEVKMLDDKFYNCFYDENTTFDKINYYVINKFELEEYYKEKIKKYFW